MEAFKAIGNEGVRILCRVFNKISGRMPEEWRKSILVPIYKGKGDPQECKNHRGIKLLPHVLKLWERVMDARLRELVEIDER